MILPNPRPQGVVLFAGRDSRRREYAVYLMSAGWARVGYLKKIRPPVPRPGWSPAGSHHWYQVVKFNGVETAHRVAMTSRPDRQGETLVLDAATGATVGRARREDVVDLAGKVQMKNDSDGMFRPVAHAFRDFYGSQAVPFDNVHDDEVDGGLDAADTRFNFLDTVKALSGGGLDFFAYSGHGSSGGLPSAGISTTANGRGGGGFNELVVLIRHLCRADGWVLLYACSTAAPGGFAEKLSGALPGMTVIGHREEGAGSTNPRKYRIRNGASVPVQSLLPAAARERWNARALGRERLYARYPFLTPDQIAAELGGG